MSKKKIKKEEERKENSLSELRIKDSLSISKISNFQFKIFIPEFKIPHSKFQIQSQISCSKFQDAKNLKISSSKASSCKFSNLMFKILSCKFSNLKFQNSKNFKFKISNFKFQVSSFKEKNLFQGTTKIHQVFRAKKMKKFQ